MFYFWFTLTTLNVFLAVPCSVSFNSSLFDGPVQWNSLFMFICFVVLAGIFHAEAERAHKREMQELADSNRRG